MLIAQRARKGNILIDDQRNARLCDFGISRMLEEVGITDLTPMYVHTGTARCLSYELVASEDTRTPTTASDVHALACIGLEVSREDLWSFFLFLKRPLVHLSTTSVREPAERLADLSGYYRETSACRST